MTLFRSLYARLSAILLVLLLALAGVSLVVTLRTSRLYQQEVQQKLNRELAAHVMDKHTMVEDGRIRPEAAAEIFEYLMVVNPDIEVYLLDRSGAIVAHAAPPGRVLRSRVDLAAVEAFLDGDEPLPVFGDDPRDPGGRKIFSAAPLVAEGGEIGYLYVVLASEQWASVARMVEGSYILGTATWMVGGSVLLALAGGLLLVGRVTGRAEVDQLEENDRLRRELIANVSHDVRTPLTQLQGYLETLLVKEELTVAERREYLEIATVQAARLGRLVSDLFELAKLDGLDQPPRRERFSIAELVQDVAQGFRLRAAERGVELEVDVTGDPGLVEADLAVLERALQNLVENALRFSRSGDRIQVAVRPGPGSIRVEVRDSGPGIPADELPHIFDRFYRCAAPGDDEGTGLGLSIARRAVELHDADLRCESEPGVGTTFWFDLGRPAARA